MHFTYLNPNIRVELDISKSPPGQINLWFYVAIKSRANNPQKCQSQPFYDFLSIISNIRNEEKTVPCCYRSYVSPRSVTELFWVVINRQAGWELSSEPSRRTMSCVLFHGGYLARLNLPSNRKVQSIALNDDRSHSCYTIFSDNMETRG